MILKDFSKKNSTIFQEYFLNIFPKVVTKGIKSKHVWFMISCLHPWGYGYVTSPMFEEIIASMMQQ
jgi:hypothetical protein